MTTKKATRPIPLALTMLIAVFSALVALALAGGHTMTAGAATAHHDHGKKTGAVALRMDMRHLWEDHVSWTRLAIISLTTTAPDTQATVARLLQNQDDIGDAIKPYYGDAAGTQLSSLLRQHILIAADLIAAAMKGDQAAIASEQARWTANADQIAEFLAAANPRFWSVGPMKEMLHEHLRLTTDEVVARLQHEWATDVKTYDEIVDQGLGMADMLSDGIIGQFPGRFHKK